MELADEIRAMITGFPKPLDADNAPYSEGFMTATIKAAELVEKREAERAERIKDCINVKVRRKTQQVFIIERAPECKPLSIQNVLIGLDMCRQNSEWDVREVVPFTENEIVDMEVNQ